MKDSQLTEHINKTLDEIYGQVLIESYSLNEEESGLDIIGSITRDIKEVLSRSTSSITDNQKNYKANYIFTVIHLISLL